MSTCMDPSSVGMHPIDESPLSKSDISYENYNQWSDPPTPIDVLNGTRNADVSTPNDLGTSTPNMGNPHSSSSSSSSKSNNDSSPYSRHLLQSSPRKASNRQGGSGRSSPFSSPLVASSRAASAYSFIVNPQINQSFEGEHFLDEESKAMDVMKQAATKKDKDKRAKRSKTSKRSTRNDKEQSKNKSESDSNKSDNSDKSNIDEEKKRSTDVSPENKKKKDTKVKKEKSAVKKEKSIVKKEKSAVKKEKSAVKKEKSIVKQKDEGTTDGGGTTTDVTPGATPRDENNSKKISRDSKNSKERTGSKDTLKERTGSKDTLKEDTEPLIEADPNPKDKRGSKLVLDDNTKTPKEKKEKKEKKVDSEKPETDADNIKDDDKKDVDKKKSKKSETDADNIKDDDKKDVDKKKSKKDKKTTADKKKNMKLLADFEQDDTLSPTEKKDAKAADFGLGASIEGAYDPDQKTPAGFDAQKAESEKPEPEAFMKLVKSKDGDSSNRGENDDGRGGGDRSINYQNQGDRSRPTWQPEKYSEHGRDTTQDTATQKGKDAGEGEQASTKGATRNLGKGSPQDRIFSSLSEREMNIHAHAQEQFEYRKRQLEFERGSTIIRYQTPNGMPAGAAYFRGNLNDPEEEFRLHGEYHDPHSPTWMTKKKVLPLIGLSPGPDDPNQQHEQLGADFYNKSSPSYFSKQKELSVKNARDQRENWKNTVLHTDGSPQDGGDSGNGGESGNPRGKKGKKKGSAGGSTGVDAKPWGSYDIGRSLMRPTGPSSGPYDNVNRTPSPSPIDVDPKSRIERLRMLDERIGDSHYPDHDTDKNYHRQPYYKKYIDDAGNEFFTNFQTKGLETTKRTIIQPQTYGADLAADGKSTPGDSPKGDSPGEDEKKKDKEPNPSGVHFPREDAQGKSISSNTSSLKYQMHSNLPKIRQQQDDDPHSPQSSSPKGIAKGATVVSNGLDGTQITQIGVGNLLANDVLDLHDEFKQLEHDRKQLEHDRQKMAEQHARAEYLRDREKKQIREAREANYTKNRMKKTGEAVGLRGRDNWSATKKKKKKKKKKGSSSTGSSDVDGENPYEPNILEPVTNCLEDYNNTQQGVFTHPTGYASIARLGLGVLSNTEFEKKAHRQCRQKMKELEAISGGIKEQLAKCWGEIKIVEHDVRKEEERNSISNLIAKEINTFKEDWRKRTEEEDKARLRMKVMERSRIEGTFPVYIVGNGDPVPLNPDDPNFEIIDRMERVSPKNYARNPRPYDSDLNNDISDNDPTGLPVITHGGIQHLIPDVFADVDEKDPLTIVSGIVTDNKRAYSPIRAQLSSPPIRDRDVHNPNYNRLVNPQPRTLITRNMSPGLYVDGAMDSDGEEDEFLKNNKDLKQILTGTDRRRRPSIDLNSSIGGASDMADLQTPQSIAGNTRPVNFSRDPQPSKYDIPQNLDVEDEELNYLFSKNMNRLQRLDKLG